jgi:16S rRNA (guanine1207-N2)-methyltransferase
MAQRPKPTAADLLGDTGVLDDASTLEVFGFAANGSTGGLSVLPIRTDWLQAREARTTAVSSWPEVSNDRFAQTVVHLQKGRAATWQGLSGAWRRLKPGGRLLLVGGNELGIKSAVKRLSGELGQPAEILANRARARVACWRREGTFAPERPVIPPFEVVTDHDRFKLSSAAGVFSADGVDPGTQFLLDHLGELDPPTSIFDPGCGLGVLGLSALRRWPEATAVLADVDHRAVECATRNAADLSLAHRLDVMWWDAVSDPPPARPCDLVLVNPPFHSGVPVDLQPARAIFAAIDAVLSPGGRALIVANRTLPWERDLREIGHLRQAGDRSGYKILEVTK